VGALISLSFGGAIGLMFLMLGCALPIYKYLSKCMFYLKQPFHFLQLLIQIYLQ
uniref:Uncharacterized protein n=1 Tax=Sus scrofa TaxID=9823 RepID=A0A8D1HBQ5_PIG